MPRYSIEETHAGTVTSRLELSEGELRRARPEFIRFLDEGLTSLHLVTKRRELRLRPVASDEARLRCALALAGCDFGEDEVSRLMAMLGRGGEVAFSASD